MSRGMTSFLAASRARNEAAQCTFCSMSNYLLYIIYILRSVQIYNELLSNM
jgi:hypothetical protein